jgi:hypothetical protein
MADLIDKANDYAAAESAAGEATIRQLAAEIPTGEPGDCDLCGEWTGRLVGGACAPCRDARRLP